MKVFLKVLGLFESSCVFHGTIPPLNYVSWVIFALKSRRKKGEKKVVFVVLLPFWCYVGKCNMVIAGEGAFFLHKNDIPLVFYDCLQYKHRV